MHDLTDRQQEVFRFMVESARDRGFPPTVREVQAAFGFRSPKAVTDHLRALQQKGYVRIAPRKARGMEFLRRPVGEHGGGSVRAGGGGFGGRGTVFGRARFRGGGGSGAGFSLPLLGRVRAGMPVLAEENREGAVSVDPGFFRERPDFALRVVGDSMSEGGILEGDVVLVRLTHEAKNGDTVVAITDDNATVKVFRRVGQRVELHPRNAAFKPIVIEKDPTFRIVGRVVGVLRAT
ncbi:MAG: transcriptional repressor LexA [Planctomycetes bacterium]|nr:transcriptional repressor LexA [Planctomycetota bacterium]